MSKAFGLLLAVAALLLVALPSQSRAAIEAPARIEFTGTDSTLFVQPDSGAMQFRANPKGSPMTARIQPLRDRLGEYFRSQPSKKAHSLSVGPYPELNARMASLASCSADWDARRGQPRSGPIGPWLLGLLNLTRAHQELVAAVEPLGYDIHVAALEKVVLCRPDQIDWASAARSCPTVLPARARLPCGALVTFSLTPK